MHNLFCVTKILVSLIGGSINILNVGGCDPHEINLQGTLEKLYG